MSEPATTVAPGDEPPAARDARAPDAPAETPRDESASIDATVAHDAGTTRDEEAACAVDAAGAAAAPHDSDIRPDADATRDPALTHDARATGDRVASGESIAAHDADVRRDSDLSRIPEPTRDAGHSAALREWLAAGEALAAAAPRPASRRRRAFVAAGWAVLLIAWLAVVVGSLRLGHGWREWAWRETAPIRFRGDVANAMRIGSAVNDAAVARADARAKDAGQPPIVRPPSPRSPVAPWGDVWAAYLDKYDLTLRAATRGVRGAGDPPLRDDAFDIDYPPGRLLAITAWVRIARADPALDPSPRAIQDDAIWPMRRLNAAHEFLAAIGAFALAWRTLRDAGRSRARTLVLATLPAVLVWLNPAVILVGHGWPQWDAWVLPYAIWATYFGLSRRWLLAGAALAVGAMFKGQTLLVAPLLLLWPAFRLDVDAVARLAIGFLFAAAVCLSPWLLMTTPARAWVIGVVIGVVAIAAMTRRRRRARSVRQAFLPVSSPPAQPSFDDKVSASPADSGQAGMPVLRKRPTNRGLVAWSVLAAFTAGWLVAPFLVPGGPSIVPAMLLLAVVAVALPGVWRGRGVAVALLVIGCATFAAGARFDGSFAWLQVGFQTDRYPRMSLGRVANVPALLAASWSYGVETQVPWFGDRLGGDTIGVRTLLRGIVYAGLALIAFSMARAQRMRSANFLIALPAAWALIYAALPQMHERYLLWAAATSALLAARSVAGLLAHLLLTAVQVLCLMMSMVEARRLLFDPKWGVWFRTAQGIVPEAGHAVALMACVLIAWSFAKDGGRRAPMAE